MAQNIKVAVRARPLNQREIDMDCDVVISMQDRTTTILVHQTPKHFTYDFVYSSMDPSDPTCATQTDIYQEIGATILSNAIDGFNGTLFAYGQTGSGKSHTMMGLSEDYGIIPLMISDLFTKKAQIEEDDNKELQVWVSYLEIYKERITDLFGAVDKQQEVKIMEHPKLGVYTKGMEEFPCESKEAVMANLEYGLQRRSIGATNMNQTSSRSHAVFCIKTTALHGPKPMKKGGSVQDGRKALSAKINLIDLAGSERASKTGAEGVRLKEGSAINMSLSALGMVIKALTEKKESKVPFRASKLTFLLKDSLAGNARTYMMAAISPASDNLDETLSTLRFASSVKTIETVAVQNKDKKDQLIEDLQEEMKLLKSHLALGGVDSEDALEQLRERERLVQEELRKDFQEQLEVAKELRRAREQALEENGLSHHSINQAFGIDSTTPYLVNMAFDPMLAGCLIYLIKESEPTRIGAHKDNSIILDGIGIPEFLCRIVNSSGTGVKIKRLSDKGRVGVNAKLLKANEELQLHNGDQVYLGRSTALKLVCPDVDGQAPLNKNDFLLEGDMELAMLEHSPSWASLEMFIDPVLRQMSSAAASTFVQDVKRACQLSDEANELTAEYRKDLPFQFEVDLTSSMPPCLVIRVLTCPQGRGCLDEEAWRTKYVWRLSQLEERVDRMRDYSREVKRDAKVTLAGLEDPWVEAEPMEIVQQLRDLQHVADEADKAMLQQLTMSGSGVSNSRSIVSIVFWFWKSFVTAGKKRHSPSKTGRPALVRSGTNFNRMRMTVVPSHGGPWSPRSRRSDQAVGTWAAEVSGAPAASTSPPKRHSARGSTGSAGSAGAPAEAARCAAPAASAKAAADEAPEATPELIASEPEASASASASLAADRELIATLRSAAHEAERSVLALEQQREALKRQLGAKEAECQELRKLAAGKPQPRPELSEDTETDLRKQLRDSQAENEDLRRQLEVAWQLSTVLRDQLLSMRPQVDETASIPELHPPDVVATADALAATARSVTAAAQAVHDIRAALTGPAPCSAPPTSVPGSTPVLLLERQWQAAPIPWISLLPCERGSQSASRSRPRGARSASPSPLQVSSSTPSAGLVVASPAGPLAPWPSSCDGACVGAGARATSSWRAAGASRVLPPCSAGHSQSSPSRARPACMACGASGSPSPLRLRPPGSGAHAPFCTPRIPMPAAPAAGPGRPPGGPRSLSPQVARTPPWPSGPSSGRTACAGAALHGDSGGPGPSRLVLESSQALVPAVQVDVAPSPAVQLSGRLQGWPPPGMPGG